jgi:hypothetical protein
MRVRFLLEVPRFSLPGTVTDVANHVGTTGSQPPIIRAGDSCRRVP